LFLSPHPNIPENTIFKMRPSLRQFQCFCFFLLPKVLVVEHGLFFKDWVGEGGKIDVVLFTEDGEGFVGEPLVYFLLPTALFRRQEERLEVVVLFVGARQKLQVEVAFDTDFRVGVFEVEADGCFEVGILLTSIQPRNLRPLNFHRDHFIKVIRNQFH
jgi:hypothetical protein